MPNQSFNSRTSCAGTLPRYASQSPLILRYESGRNIGCLVIHSRKKKPEEPKERLVPTPIPALVAILLNKEREKGSPLTEDEVLEIRDNAVCMMLQSQQEKRWKNRAGIQT